MSELEQPSAASTPSNASIQTIHDEPIDSTDQPEPVEEDPHTKTVRKLMEASQQGDLDTMKELIESKQVGVNEHLNDNVSALHWCAINNKLTAMKYLVSKGADVDYVGGDLNATPLLWACRYGLVYIADYLIKECAADYTKQDAQGFGCLHLSVHSSNIMMVIYIVRTTDLGLDSVDPKGRTALHWAAYQGDMLTVEYLVKIKASVNTKDEMGFIPLHWALVRQSKTIMVTLIEAGSDLQEEANDGKSCWDIARDMNCVELFTSALRECSYKNDFSKKHYLISDMTAKAITFLSPHVVLPLCLWVISSVSVIIGLVLAFGITLLQGLYLTKLIIPVYMRKSNPLIKSPFFAGVFSSTGIWCILTWAMVLLPITFKKRAFTNFIFLIFSTATMYAFYKGARMNPGYVEPETNPKQIEALITQLISLRKFDAANYCIYTDVRVPLRSKFSRISNRNVARFDHYCPWLYNEVGVRNHKVFYAFSVFLAITIVDFILLTFKYFDKLDVDDDLEESCPILSEDLCAGYHGSRFMFALLVWVIIQLMWLSLLLFGQSFQISRGYTTYEFSENSKGEVDFSSIPTDEDTGNKDNGVEVPSQVKLACIPAAVLNSKLSQVLGINQFALISNDMLKNRGQASAGNPYNYGFKLNWLNFLFLKYNNESYTLRGLFKLPHAGEANLGDQLVDYYKLYEAPVNPRYSAV